LIPNPSEGKIRAIFGSGLSDQKHFGLKTAQPGFRKTISSTRDQTKTANANFRSNYYQTQEVISEQPGQEDIDPSLDLLNRVQMFQIAVNKINHNLEAKKKEPIFKLASSTS